MVLLENKEHRKKEIGSGAVNGTEGANCKVLPLDKREKLAILGPFADTCPVDWYSGIPEHMVPVKEALPGEFADLIPVVKIRVGDGYLGISFEENAKSEPVFDF